MVKQFYFKQFSLAKVHFSSVEPIERTLSGATTLGQSGPGSDDNKRVLRIPQSSSITRAILSDCLVSYPGYLLGSLTPLQRCSWCILQPQPTRPQDTYWGSLTPLQRCSWCILQPQPTGLGIKREDDPNIRCNSVSYPWHLPVDILCK